MKTQTNKSIKHLPTHCLTVLTIALSLAIPLNAQSTLNVDLGIKTIDGEDRHVMKFETGLHYLYTIEKADQSSSEWSELLSFDGFDDEMIFPFAPSGFRLLANNL